MNTARDLNNHNSQDATSLSDLPKGKGGIVHKILAKGLLKQKLLNMGFIPGAEIQMIRNAPLRDPIEIGIQYYMISLRRTEAALIQIHES